MQNGICVSSRDVWKVYCGLAYTEAQGTDNGGWTITSTRRPGGDGTVYPLFAVKQENITEDVSRQPILKPVHPNVTALHQMFYHDAIISFVYEEMDMTLSQALSLPLPSGMTQPAMRHRMIGAILKQVRTLRLARLSLQASTRSSMESTTYITSWVSLPATPACPKCKCVVTESSNLVCPTKTPHESFVRIDPYQPMSVAVSFIRQLITSGISQH